MKNIAMFGSLAAAMAMVTMPAATTAFADPGHGHGHNKYEWHGNERNWNPADSYHRGNYKARRMGRNDHIYRGRDGRVYCRRSDGTTGLVIGAVGGAALGNIVGGGTLGTLAGGVGGALLGRSIDRGNLKCR